MHQLVSSTLERCDGPLKRATLESYADLDQAFARVHHEPPDLMLVGTSQIDLPGVGSAARLKALSPDLRILVLLEHSDAKNLLLALAAGALGCLVKPFEPAQLEPILHRAAGGHVALCLRAQEILVNHIFLRFPEDLSPRERQILVLVLFGLREKQMEDRLGIKPHTIHEHLKRLYLKLGVHSRVEAIALFARTPPD